MAGQREAQSVPWFADERPAEVIADGVRLDGRSLEEFRNVCESKGTPAAGHLHLPPFARRPSPAHIACLLTCAASAPLNGQS